MTLIICVTYLQVTLGELDRIEIPDSGAGSEEETLPVMLSDTCTTIDDEGPGGENNEIANFDSEPEYQYLVYGIAS